MTNGSTNDWPLEACALSYLRYDCQCLLVCSQRSPWEDGMRPDIVGVTLGRRVIEIEIKRTMADFRANQFKQRRWRYNSPWKYYFLVPPCLADRALNELKENEGLLTVAINTEKYGLPLTYCLARAGLNDDAQPLSVALLTRMVRHNSATLCKLAAENWRLRQGFACK